MDVGFQSRGGTRGRSLSSEVMPVKGGGGGGGGESKSGWVMLVMSELEMKKMSSEVVRNNLTMCSRCNGE